MHNCLATKILSIAMMMLTPAAMLMAETGNTMLYASGNVTLNGTEVAGNFNAVRVGECNAERN